MITQKELNIALKEYYMPYAMKVITDRAIPDVRDGLKPIARKILWTLWNNGVRYNTPRDKSSKIVGDVLKIHNHGDTSVYLAMALLTEQNESLLHPFINGEGAFGKIYSNDSPSAMRYTSARLNKFAEEMFIDINKNTVKFIGEDKNHIQPLILTNTFPNILIKPNNGMAVGESCNWASFNLKEICSFTQEYIKNKNTNIWDYIQAPDFSTGGYVIVNKSEMDKIFNTGKGKFKLRAKYRYDSINNIIEVYEIPYNSTVDNIIKDITNLMNQGSCKEIIDVKDGTEFNKKLKKETMGIEIEVKKNTNIDFLMTLLFKKTRLETSFSCNFNCLVDYKPKVLGITDILDEWLKFRVKCIKSSMNYDIQQKSETLHYLKGLEKVLLDIDKAINIIRNSENDEKIISNLINTFKIDEKQAIEISNMKLKNINKQYIINKIKSIKEINNEINNLSENVKSNEYIKNIIILQLEQVKNKYSISRKSEIIYSDQIKEVKKEDLIKDYSVTIVLTKQQYLKKTLKYSEIQKLKENDEVLQLIQTNNTKDLLLFTNQGRVFTRKIYELRGTIECTAGSGYGEYIPNILQENLNKDEKIIYIASPDTYDKGYMLYIFENNNLVKMAMKPYECKQNRQVAQDAFNTDSPLKYIKYIDRDIDILTLSSEGKMLIQNTKDINPKASNGGKKSNGNSFVKLGDNDLIGVIFEPKEDDIIKFKTEKKECIEINLSDICQSSKDKTTYYSYCFGRKNTQGNFIYNCRQKQDRIIELL